MRGGRKWAKPACGRPLDGRVRRLSALATGCHVRLTGFGRNGDWAGSLGNCSSWGTACAVRFEMCPAWLADRYQRHLPLLVKVIDEASFVGLFPDRQTRTRGAPSFKNLGIRARMRADLFKEVQDQRLYGVRHCYLRH